MATVPPGRNSWFEMIDSYFIHSNQTVFLRGCLFVCCHFFVCSFSFPSFSGPSTAKVGLSRKWVTAPTSFPIPHVTGNVFSGQPINAKRTLLIQHSITGEQTKKCSLSRWWLNYYRGAESVCVLWCVFSVLDSFLLFKWHSVCIQISFFFPSAPRLLQSALFTVQLSFKKFGLSFYWLSFCLAFKLDYRTQPANLVKWV